MSLKDKVRDAGIAGCGGAGFPTAVKLGGTYEYLIVNGVECEPLLRTDRYIMRTFADRVVSAVSAVQKELAIPNAVIALKHNYTEEIESLKKAIKAAGAPVTIHELESFYPAGDEQTLVYEVTGRIVPPGGIPGKVGAVVDNVGTMLAIQDALEDKPFTHKYLTVNGDVAKPAVLRVPVGTSFAKCLELAGGTLNDKFVLVSGGPAMGRIIKQENLDREFVTKTTSGILVLPADGYHASYQDMNPLHMLSRARSACIQCSFCSQLCPRALLGHPLRPHKIMRRLAVSADIASVMDDPEIQAAQLCCECGVCEIYACPMGLQPRRINGLIKREMAARKLKYNAGDIDLAADAERENRKAPSKKLAGRMGLASYYDNDIKTFMEYQADQVSIPLKMAVGAPCVPCVKKGDAVKAGDVIAKVPENALGAQIHASIEGRVASVDDKITIVKE